MPAGPLALPSHLGSAEHEDMTRALDVPPKSVTRDAVELAAIVLAATLLVPLAVYFPWLIVFGTPTVWAASVLVHRGGHASRGRP